MSTRLKLLRTPDRSRPLTESGVSGETGGGHRARERVLRELYHNHGKALHAFVAGLVSGDHQQAEDVVQETMLRAWRNAEKLDHDRPSLRPWLFAVARRIVIDAHRTREARPREVEASVLEQMADADEVDRRLASLTVSAALESLSLEHQTVLREVYFRGSKVREAAETLCIPPGTVKSRTYYALRALRLALEERGITDPE